MSIVRTDVLGSLAYASSAMFFAPEIPGYNGTLFAVSEETKERIEDITKGRAIEYVKIGYRNRDMEELAAVERAIQGERHER